MFLPKNERTNSTLLLMITQVDLFLFVFQKKIEDTKKSFWNHLPFRTLKVLTPLWKLSEHFSFTLQLLRHSPNFHEIWTLDNLVFKMPLKSKREISYISDKINVIRVVKFLSWSYISVILAIYRTQLCPTDETSKFQSKSDLHWKKICKTEIKFFPEI